VLGPGFVWTGYRRATSVEDALDRGGFAPLGGLVPGFFIVCGLVLGAATIAVLLLDH
jgi:hypothetical protein